MLFALVVLLGVSTPTQALRDEGPIVSLRDGGVGSGGGTQTQREHITKHSWIVPVR